MIGTVHWFPLAVVLAALAFVGWMWARSRRADARFKVEEKSVRCRARGNQLVHVTLVRDARTGEAIGVKSCSITSPPDNIKCARECMHLLVPDLAKADGTAAAAPADANT